MAQSCVEPSDLVAGRDTPRDDDDDYSRGDVLSEGLSRIIEEADAGGAAEILEARLAAAMDEACELFGDGADDENEGDKFQEWVEADRTETGEEVVDRFEDALLEKCSGSARENEKLVTDQLAAREEAHERAGAPVLEDDELARMERDVRLSVLIGNAGEHGEAGRASEETSVVRPAPPPVPEDSGLIESTFNMWAPEARKGIDALKHRLDATRKERARDNRNLALVAHDVAAGSEGPSATMVSYVNWKGGDAAGRVGQTVLLDGFNRIIWSVVTHHPYRSFASSTIVHPDLGARMMKISEEYGKRDPTRFRPLMPEVCVRLKQMWELSLATGDDARCSLDALSTCTHCSTARPDVRVRQCAICLQTWHPECCRAVMEARSEQIKAERALEPTALDEAVPATIAGAACALCSCWISDLLWGSS